MDKDNICQDSPEQGESKGSKKRLGKIAFEAAMEYRYAMDPDDDVPLWSNQTPGEQSDWEAAAQAVRNAVIDECADLIETSPFINKSAAEIIGQSLRSLKGSTDNDAT